MDGKPVSVWILGDQLLDTHPAIEAATDEHGAGAVRILLVESRHRTRRLAYHRKKLTLLFSAMRHYAHRLEEDGYTVDYHKADSFLTAIRDHVQKHKATQLYTMEASAYGGRRWQKDSLQEHLNIPVNVVPNTQFLCGQYNPFPNPEPGKRYVMERFYRKMRQHFDLLMDEDDEPAGGEWNYDKQNRKPYRKGLSSPPIRRFAPDEITLEVMQEIKREGIGCGTVDDFDLAVTHAQAQQLADDFVQHRLPDFGTYEDAMSNEQATLFHSVLSPYLNIGLLEPLPLARMAEAAYHSGDAPINSAEGYIRQIIGWREYMYWQYWRMMPDILQANDWQAHRPLPEWYWNADTDMHCLHTVIERVMNTGYAHHIERLMLLSNFALLAGLDPQAVNDWFTSTFIDAYEWVMAPNVLGMGLNADGGIIATKPYIASANYINKMSDYCRACRYDPKQRTGDEACPFNALYWRFLIQNEDKLRASPRLGRNVLGLRHLDHAERQEVLEHGDSILGAM